MNRRPLENHDFLFLAGSINLTNAITTTGENYEEIGKLFEEQPKMDWERLGDVMHDYRGLLAGWPNVLQIHAVRNVPSCTRGSLPGFFSEECLVESQQSYRILCFSVTLK